MLPGEALRFMKRRHPGERRSFRIHAAMAIILAVAFAIAAAGNPVRAQEQVDHMTLIEQLTDEVAVEVLDELQFPTGTTVYLVPETQHEANWLVANILARELIERGCTSIAPSVGGQPLTPAVITELPEVAETPIQQLPGQADAGLWGEEASEESEEADSAAVADSIAAADSVAAAQQQAAPAGPAPGQRQLGGQRGPRGQQQPEAGPAPTQPAAFEVALPPQGNALVFRVIECGVSYPWAKRSWLIGPRKYGRMASVKLWASWVEQPGSKVQHVASGERLQLDSFPGSIRPVMEGRGYPFAIEQPNGSSLRTIVEPVVVTGIVSGLVYLFYQNQK